MWDKNRNTGIVDQNGHQALVDDETRAIINLPEPHAQLHNGRKFTIHYGVVDIGAMTSPNDAIQLHFTTPADREIHMIFDGECFAAGAWTLREAPTGGLSSPTGSFSPINRRRYNPLASGITEVFYDATLGTGGTILESYPIGSGTTPAAAQHGNARAGNEFELNLSTVYCVSIYCTASVAATLELDWYEILL